MNAKQKALKEQYESALKTAQDGWSAFSRAREEATTKGNIAEDAIFTALTEKKQAFEAQSKEADKARTAFMNSLEVGGGDNLGTKERLFGDWPSGLSDSFESAGLKALDATSGGTATSAFFDPEIRTLPQRRLFVRSLIPVKQISNEKFDFLRQTAAALSAAETAAGSVKPTSTLSLERVEDRVRVIATLGEPVDRSFLLDVDNLRDFIDGQLRLAVLLREDQQLISGNGTGENLRGLLNTSGIQTQARGTDPHVDTVLKGIVKVQTQNFQPNGLVLHPTDVQTMLLARDANGNYQASDAGALQVNDEGAVRVWGLEVISSTALTQGTGLLGDFRQCTLYDREQARVDWFESGLLAAGGTAELASRNQIAARAEERVGFACHRPLAFVSLTGL
jgi:HK97 family phage major capsid protein